MSDIFPVLVEVSQPDGRVERVRVGTAQRTAEGFSLQLGALSIGSSPMAAPTRPAASSYGGGDAMFPNYGRSKGAPIRGASMQDLEFYANGARRTLGDPGKARFHDKERALLAAIEAEIARQRGEGGADGEPPPPGDEDAPF